MPQTCSICKDKRRSEIDKSLLAGESLRDVAGRTGTSRSALLRHKDHISAALTKAREAKAAAEVVQADSLLDRLKAIRTVTLEILAEARTAKQLPVALAAINRVEKQLELEAKLLGELNGDNAAAGGTTFRLVLLNADRDMPALPRIAPLQLQPAIPVHSEAVEPARTVAPAVRVRLEE